MTDETAFYPVSLTDGKAAHWKDDSHETVLPTDGDSDEMVYCPALPMGEKDALQTDVPDERKVYNPVVKVYVPDVLPDDSDVTADEPLLPDDEAELPADWGVIHKADASDDRQYPVRSHDDDTLHNEHDGSDESTALHSEHDDNGCNNNHSHNALCYECPHKSESSAEPQNNKMTDYHIPDTDESYNACSLHISDDKNNPCS